MKMKKILSAMMAIILVISLAACGGDSGSSGSDTTDSNDSANDTTNDTADETTDVSSNYEDIIPEETVELTAYSQLANYSGEQIGWFAEVLLEKFNVKLNIINEGDGTFDTRMANGSLGDIIAFGSDGTQYLQAVEAGMLFDWEEDNLLEEYGSYIYENMQAALEKNRELTGGTIYGFGHNVATSSENHETFFYYPDIRWDLYEQLECPEVSTLEDFVDILAAMVELEPTSDTGGKTYGVSLFPDWDGDMVMFVKSTAALYGYDEFGFGLYNTATQTYEDCLQEDGMYLRCLKFYNMLYQKGLLDPDSMTQTFDDMSEDYTTGAAFFNIFSWMGSGIYNTDAHLSEGKAMLPLAADDQTNIAYGLNIYGSNRVWGIGADSDYPELCMAILNWLSTPEGVMTKNYGPRGTNWDYDEDNNPYLTELGLQCQSDQETEVVYGNSTSTFSDGDFKINNETWSVDSINPDTDGDTYNYVTWQSTLDNKAVSDIEQSWRDFTGYSSADQYLEGEGHISISIGSTFSMASRSAELDTTWNQVATAIKAGSWNAIYADTDEEFDQIVASMREEAINYGYEECVEFTQEQAEIRKTLEQEAIADN